MSKAVILFVKFPEPGKVKTRLAAQTGPERAAEIYRRLVAAVCTTLPAGARIVVAFDPAEKSREIEKWIAPLLPARTAEFIAQASGDLGHRLTDAFEKAFARGHEFVAAIGSDCVEISPGIFEETWTALDSHDCVIGPAHDGGYYLIALKRPAPELFENIPWSSGSTCAETLLRAGGRGLSVYSLPPLPDVDSQDDWLAAERFLLHRGHPPRPVASELIA